MGLTGTRLPPLACRLFRRANLGQSQFESPCLISALWLYAKHQSTCVVHVPSEKILVAHIDAYGGGKELRIVSLDRSNLKEIIFTFDCLYFPFLGIREDTVIPVTNGTINGRSLLRKDFVCSFLLRHPWRHRLYYVVRMDGRELTLSVKQSTGEFLVKFCYPTTRKMLTETSKRCKTDSNLINQLTVHHFLPEADNTEKHNT